MDTRQFRAGPGLMQEGKLPAGSAEWQELAAYAKSASYKLRQYVTALEQANQTLYTANKQLEQQNARLRLIARQAFPGEQTGGQKPC